MWPFSTTENIEPAPAPPVDREAVLLAELREIDWQLAALDVEMRQFRTKHSLRTDRFSRIIGAQTASLTGVAGIQREWQVLLKRGDKLFFARNDVLKEWSALRLEK